MSRRGLLPLAVVLVVALALGPAASFTSAQARTVRGTVVEVRANATPPTISVRQQDGTAVTLRVSESASVQRRGETGAFQPSKLADLRAGDEVMVSVNEQGEAIAILATPAPTEASPPSRASAAPVATGRIGIWLDVSTTPPTIVVLDGSPAAQAGVSTGDRLIALDGTQFELGSATLQRSGLELTGAPGSTVELTIQQAGQTRKLPVTRTDSSALIKDTATFPYAANQVWSAIADLVTSAEPIFPPNPPRRDLPFSTLYSVKSASKDLGLISFETYQLGRPGSGFIDIGYTFGRDGLELLFEIPKSGLMALAVWDSIKITPSMRVLDKGQSTSVRVSLTVEGWNNIVGWTPLKSRGMLEGVAFVALMKRLRH